MTKTIYSTVELAAMKLPGYPASRQGWEKIVEREAWEYREIKSRGRNGMVRQYLIPEHISQLISQHEEAQAGGADTRKQAEPRCWTQEEKLERIRQIFKEAATPAEPTITVEMKLSPIQAKAVFDALAALSEVKRDA